jgi:hypothetical protein
VCQPAGKLVEPLERLQWQVLSDVHIKVNQLTVVLFPKRAKKYRGIKTSSVGSAQRIRERTGVTEKMQVRKNHALVSNS